MKISFASTFKFPTKRWYVDTYYKVKGWIFRPYTTIKSRHLPHTWIDKDDILVYSIFEILERFVENECGENTVVAWDHECCSVEHNGKTVSILDVWKEILQWWNEEFLPYKDFKAEPQLNYTNSMPEFEMVKCEDVLFEGEATFDMIDKYRDDKHKEDHELAIKELWIFEDRMEKELEEKIALIIKHRHMMWT